MNAEERERDESYIKRLFPEHSKDEQFVDDMVKILRYI